MAVREKPSMRPRQLLAQKRTLVKPGAHNAPVARTKAHPADDLRTFAGFPEILALEREFLPSEEVSAKYAGAIGYRPET
jgi:hypothetical protein